MPLSFFDFLAQLARNPALTGTVMLTLAVLLVNGWTDAPNAIAGVVVTGALPFRPAVFFLAGGEIFWGVCGSSVSASLPGAQSTPSPLSAAGQGPLSPPCAPL